jgi:hypothetical protein
VWNRYNALSFVPAHYVIASYGMYHGTFCFLHLVIDVGDGSRLFVSTMQRISFLLSSSWKSKMAWISKDY